MTYNLDSHSEPFSWRVFQVKHLLTLTLVIGTCFAPLSVVAGELDNQVCQRLLSELEPGKEAVWRTIPWKIAVLEAQQIAFKEDKPIFIWAMDGHPLGCT